MAHHYNEQKPDIDEATSRFSSKPLHSRSAHTTYIAPRTEVEQVLVPIWQETFGIDSIGVHDSFSELGGTSLLATKLVLRISEAFQLSLSPAHILELRTIANIAEMIDKIIIEKVEDLSEEEVQQLVDNWFFE